MTTLRLFAGQTISVPVGTSWYLADLSEYCGKQELYTRQSPPRLKALREHTMVESAVSSNRIEGVLVDPPPGKRGACCAKAVVPGPRRNRRGQPLTRDNCPVTFESKNFSVPVRRFGRVEKAGDCAGGEEEMITLEQLTTIIARGEQLDVEFKSARRNPALYDPADDEITELKARLQEALPQ